MTDTQTPPKKTRSGWLNVAIDYGPLIVFLLSFYLFRPDGDDSVGTLVAIIKSTGAFIVAAIAALIASKLLTGQISKMLMLSTVLIVGFGGMTILLRVPPESWHCNYIIFDINIACWEPKFFSNFFTFLYHSIN